MTRQFLVICVYILLLSAFLQTHQIHCLRRLMRRKLSAETISNENSDDIRNIISSSLVSNNPQMIADKRDVSSDRAEDAALMNSAEDNVASESKDASIYEDDVEEDDAGQQQQQQVEDSEYKRSLDADSGDEPAIKSANESEVAVVDDSELKEVKDVAKREAKNEDDYDESDVDSNSDILESSRSLEKEDSEVPRSITHENKDDLEKSEHPRDTSAEVNSDLNYEKQIEDQIQQRIDSIKEDIKREIERKQRVREIETNNAKYDELEFRREDDEEGNAEVVDESVSSQSKRSNSPDLDATNSADKVGVSSSGRSKRSDLASLKEADKVEENKNTPLVGPVKKRSFERRVTLVEKRDLPNPRKRKDLSSILIPERGRVKVEDELPGDLTLDPNIRVVRSSEEKMRVQENSESKRSVVRDDESLDKRYRRDMSEEFENEGRARHDEVPDESSNFLFPAREKTDCRMRRRRSRLGKQMRSVDRRKTRKQHPRRSRRHRAVRDSSAIEEDLEEERDKRAMSLDEDAALEYKESFGGFQSESGGALARFKRIKRSSKVS